MFHTAVVNHLVRRTYEETTAEWTAAPFDNDVKTFRLSTWALAMLSVTGLLYFLVMTGIEYTYGTVVATLAMVEAPTSVAIIKAEVADSEDPDAALLTPVEKASEKTPLAEAEFLVIKAQPITASFRTTIRHLVAHGGRRSLLRGAKAALAFHFMHFATTRFIMFIFGRQRSFEPLAAWVAAIVLSRVNMTWTHVVISENSPKRWWLRLPSIQSARKTVPAMALWATAHQLTVLMPSILFQNFGLTRYIEDPESWGQLPGEGRIEVMNRVLLVCVVGLAVEVLILLPAKVTLKRVQASQLPEEYEGIVPFDRTFGGRVVAESAGGKGVLGLLEAWRSFDWAARIRLVKIYLKTGAIQVAVSVLFLGLVYGELRLIMGNTLDKMVATYAEQINSHSRT
ncbi:hypothetical protein LPUS_03950 [Lasallia pustulata]|uniref:Uncharacterized protein n=1 Tax=Lasallia pustulata TaxID=136370 RepID=A0A1W5CVR7_9LECA|nr:hypothetical protein LPUS_03950 [Lasallia pustulata]